MTGVGREWQRHGTLAPMTITIEKEGRVVIPAGVRGPQLVRRGERLVARPGAAEGQRTEIDVARLIEEERGR